MAIKTTEVGVETFSLTLKIQKKKKKEMKEKKWKTKQSDAKSFKVYRKRRLRTENEQISTPDPAIPEKIPPTNPVIVNISACQTPNPGIES